MADAEAKTQHLTPDTVEEYFSAGISAAFPLSTAVSAVLEIDPSLREIRLLCPALGASPDVAIYERITVERINILGKPGNWFRLTVDATAMHYEAYILIESIVDQLERGTSFRHAVSESLSGLKELLSGRRRMTGEREAGLIGELILLNHVIDRHGEDLAIRAWLGPLSEEHDFRFDTFDAEVKTTRAEARVHIVGSESQLQPSPGRPLYLVSLQITLAGMAAEGFTLAELIDQTRARIDRAQGSFDSALEDLGWVDVDSDLYRTKFQLRSEPRAYLIDDDFPAITGPRLDHVIPQRALVSAVSYRVDVSHLPFAVPVAPLNEFCQEPA